MKPTAPESYLYAFRNVIGQHIDGEHLTYLMTDKEHRARHRADVMIKGLTYNKNQV